MVCLIYSVRCDGDIEVDQHHTVEDIGIVLGQAFYESIGTKEGIDTVCDGNDSNG